MASHTSEELASLPLPWEVTDPTAGMSCGNYSTLAAIVDAREQKHAGTAPAVAAPARLAAVERPAQRLQALMKQLHEPVPMGGLDFGRQSQSPEVRAARAAAAEALGPITEHTVFEPQPLHFKMPHGYWLREAAAVAVDGDDFVYVFCRGNMPVLVFDPDGNLVNGWGNPTPFEGTFVYKDPYGGTQAGWRGAPRHRPQCHSTPRSPALPVLMARADQVGERVCQQLHDAVAAAPPGTGCLQATRSSRRTRSWWTTRSTFGWSTTSGTRSPRPPRPASG